MTDQASSPTRQMSARAGFWTIAYVYLVVMALSTLPSPLYSLYQQRDGFSAFTVTLVYGVYAFGVLATLLLLGHLSDWLGRRTLLMPALALAMASALIFIFWPALPGLYLGRVVGGMAVGIVVSTATAYLTDLHARDRPGQSNRRAEVVASVVNVGGLGLGPLIAGVLASSFAAPLITPFVVMAIAIAAGTLAAAFVPETRIRLDPLPRYRPQQLSVPEEGRAGFIGAAIAAVISFGSLGLFTGLAGTFLITTLHHHSLTLVGASVALVFFTGIVAQVATSSWSIRPTIGWGMASILLGIALTVLAAWLTEPNLALFLIGGGITGAGCGALFRGTIATAIGLATPTTRAATLTAVFVAGYAGLSVPVIAVGVALISVSPKVAMAGFGGGVALLCAAAAPSLWRATAIEPGASRTS